MIRFIFRLWLAACGWFGRSWPVRRSPPFRTCFTKPTAPASTARSPSVGAVFNRPTIPPSSRKARRSGCRRAILRVQLVPTTTSTPPSTYTVTYNSDGRVQFQETWSVPSSTQPLHVRDVRVAAGASSGSSTAGADTTSTVPESSVVGLIADLGARPLKSPSFAPGRTAVVDINGMVSSAAGNATDCVHVDGSSGPCGSGSAFVHGRRLAFGNRGWVEHGLRTFGRSRSGHQPGGLPQRDAAKGGAGLHADGQHCHLRGRGHSAARRYAAGQLPHGRGG